MAAGARRRGGRAGVLVGARWRGRRAAGVARRRIADVPHLREDHRAARRVGAEEGRDRRHEQRPVRQPAPPAQERSLERPGGPAVAPRGLAPRDATIGTNFEGISKAVSGCGCDTPHATAATSGTRILEATEGFMQAYDNAGAIMCGATLGNLMGSAETLADPQVQYDNLAGRFILTTAVTTGSGQAAGDLCSRQRHQRSVRHLERRPDQLQRRALHHRHGDH